MKKVVLVALLLSICSGAIVMAAAPQPRSVKPVIVVISDDPALAAMVVRKLSHHEGNLPNAPMIPISGALKRCGPPPDSIPCPRPGTSLGCDPRTGTWSCIGTPPPPKPL